MTVAARDHANTPQLVRVGSNRMTHLGHEDAFLRPKLSARCRFSQGTFAGTWGNGRDAPKATIRASGSETAVGHSAIARLRSDHCRQTDSRCCRAWAERGDALP